MSVTGSALHWMPLTLPQLDFWEEFSLHPDEPLSTVAHYIELKGTVNEEALCRAIAQTAQETDVLALRFRLDDDDKTPLQAHDPARIPQVEIKDLRSSAQPLADAKALMDGDVNARLNLLRDQLSAQWLIKLSDNHYLWYIRAHHIVMDGFGMTLFEQRCATLYQHYLERTDAGKPFNAFVSFLDEEQSYQASTRYQQDKAFWRDYLSNPAQLTVLNKEDDYGEETLHVAHELTPAMSHDIRQLAHQVTMGWPDLLVTLSGLYMHRYLADAYLGQGNAMPLWIPFMSRWGSVGAYMPALLVNILPLYVQVAENTSLRDYLTQTGKTLRQLYARGRYRVEQIARDQGVTENSRYFFSPFVNVLPFDPPQFAGCQVKHHVITSGPADGFNLTFRGQTNADGLVLSLDADSAAHPHDEFDQHAQRVMTFMQQVLDERYLDQPISALYDAIDQA